MIVQLSLDYVLWMLEHPDELNEIESYWVQEFTRLMNESINENSKSQTSQDH